MEDWEQPKSFLQGEIQTGLLFCSVGSSTNAHERQGFKSEITQNSQTLSSEYQIHVVRAFFGEMLENTNDISPLTRLKVARKQLGWTSLCKKNFPSECLLLPTPPFTFQPLSAVYNSFFERLRSSRVGRGHLDLSHSVRIFENRPSYHGFSYYS